MKNTTIVIAIALVAISFAACNSGNKPPNNNSDTTQGTGQANTAAVSTPAPDAKATPSIKGIVAGYLSMKNALANDNGDAAAVAGNSMVEAFQKFNKSALTTEQKKAYEDVEDDAREHAEHIGKNASNIPHQREHFDMLSKDLYELVKTFGAGQPLYQDFCPMYNDGKGATWLSETKEIKNPYLGKK